jgi:hypothetical protein
MEERLTPDALRAMLGVSQVPRPADKAAFLAAVKQHCPPALRAEGRTGFVLLDVTIDEAGEVRKVDVVPAPGAPIPQAVIVRRDASGRDVQAPMPGGKSDPQLGPAADAALREVRFTPAVRDGLAVPFTLRMSIQFTP